VVRRLTTSSSHHHHRLVYIVEGKVWIWKGWAKVCVLRSGFEK
jgi:quercetin dioxygenase-like cupin family protein